MPLAETQLDNAGGLHLDGVAESLEFLAGLDKRSAIACDLDQNDLALAIDAGDDAANLESMSSKGML